MLIDSEKLKKEIKQLFTMTELIKDMTGLKVKPDIENEIMRRIKQLGYESEQMQCENCEHWEKWVLADDGIDLITCKHPNIRRETKPDFFCKYFEQNSTTKE